MSGLTVFATAQKSITNYETARSDSTLLYKIINDFWKCYLSLYKAFQGKKIVVNDLVAATNTARETLGIMKDINVDFSKIPEYMVKKINDEISLEPIQNQQPTELINKCGQILEELEKHEKISTEDVSLLLQKAYLAIILALISNITGNDIYSLINKCIIYDHMGNQANWGSDFSTLLENVTNRVLSVMFNAEKKLDIYFYLGMLNYRLNNYEKAKELLTKHSEGLIVKANGHNIPSEDKKQLVRNLISLAYCYEKSNTPHNINKAIEILDSLRTGSPILAFGTSSPISSMSFFDIDSCEQKIKMEIYHALAHFHNEKAVFHFPSAYVSIDQGHRNEDIRKARQYISEAKNLDNEDSLHSCHGLICFEDNDSFRASAIYEEALDIETVSSNGALKIELLFYLAQSKSAIANNEAEIKEIEALWDEIEGYCRDTNNHDALAQFHVIKAKAALMNSSLFNKPLSEIKYHLEGILNYRLSKYVPNSVKEERLRTIYSLNVFYALSSIFNYEISFVDGIEEAFFYLRKYLRCLQNRDTTYGTILYEKNWCLPKVNDDGTKRSRVVTDDEIFVADFNGMQIVCFGNYRNLLGSSFKVHIPARFKRIAENEIIQKLQSNEHVDVIILTPTDSLIQNDERKNVLRSIIATRVCVVALGSEAKSIADELIIGDDESPIYLAKDNDDALRMSFFLGVYELMRKNIIKPTPMLGLAPLVESKSFSFQAGERLEELLFPSNSRKSESDEIDALSDAVRSLDDIQNTIIRDFHRYPQRHKTVLEYYAGLLNGRRDISLIAFFPQQQPPSGVLLTSPYKLFGDSINDAIDFICPSKSEEQHVHDFTSVFKKTLGFDAANKSIRRAKSAGAFCSNENCTKSGCKACLVDLLEARPNSACCQLLDNLFSIVRIKKHCQCIYTKIRYLNTTGILLVITKYEDTNHPELHEICQIVNRHYHPKPIPTIEELTTTSSEDREEKKKMSVHTTKDSRFKIGVSFCGEHRSSVVLPVLEGLLKQGFSKDDIFYDAWHGHLLNGANADVKAKHIYGEQCDFVVVFFSKEYNTKPWTGGIEWEAIRGIINKKVRANNICMLNIDGIDINSIDGLQSVTVVAQNISAMDTSEIVDFIMLCKNNTN